jgi:hypothetical protein
MDDALASIEEGYEGSWDMSKSKLSSLAQSLKRENAKSLVA